MMALGYYEVSPEEYEKLVNERRSFKNDLQKVEKLIKESVYRLGVACNQENWAEVGEVHDNLIMWLPVED